MARNGRWSALLTVLWLLLEVGPARGGDDPELRVFFDQLRARNLFSIAEGYAFQRLSDPLLNADIRSDVVIELARTLADHAFLATGAEQRELFSRAEKLIDDELSRSPPPGHPALLEAQRTVSLGLRTESFCWPARIDPDDPQFRNQALEELSTAIGELKRREALTSGWTSGNKRPSGMSPAEIRGWLAQIRWWLSRLLLWRAELTAGQERASDLVEAAATARKAAGDEDDTAVTARVMLAAVERMLGNYDRCEEILKAVDSADPAPSAVVRDAVTIERVRLALDRQRPDNAVQTAAAYRADTQRWPGELAWWQLRGLIQLRNIAAEKKSTELVGDLQTTGDQLIEQVDRHVGGIWSLRCHQLWNIAESAHRFGPALDRQLRLARSALTARKWNEAESAYRAALQQARMPANEDGLMEAGWGLASTLLQQGRWAEAATEFAKLAFEHRQHERASSASLMSAYALARQFDESPTPEHRKALVADLDRHLAAWPKDSTTGEAWLMRARLLDREQRFVEAARSFLKVPKEHPQYEESLASAARCFLQAVTVDRNTSDLNAESALSELAEPLSELKPNDTGWTVAQAAFAVHAARLWLAVEPPRYARAADLMETLQNINPRGDLTDEQLRRWNLLKAEAVPVQIVALAGEGNGNAAEALAVRWDSAPPDQLLKLMQTLVEVRQSVRPEIQPRLTSLLLKTIDRVADTRDRIPQPQQRIWDLALVEAHLASGQFHRASRVLLELIRANPQDLKLAQEAVDLLQDVKNPEADEVRQLTWARQEAASKPGSPAWIAARLGRVESLLDSGQAPEAQKLFKVTALLYRRQSPPDLQQKFDALEQRLQQEP